MIFIILSNSFAKLVFIYDKHQICSILGYVSKTFACVAVKCKMQLLRRQ